MSGRLELLDWRRRIAGIYAAVRTRYDDAPADAFTIWRVARDELFGGHPQSPLAADARGGFPGLPCFDYDPSLAFRVRVDTDVAPERLDVPTSGGQTMTFERSGTVDLPFGRLDVFWLDTYGGGLFLPFRDATCGTETYGGGRYLLDTIKGADLGSSADGRLIVDFNFAYHPSCRYAPLWSCPLAPPGNRLDARIAAGERL